jgi:hypothetical protein
MKLFFTRVIKSLLLLFFPGLLFAQEKIDYTILLNSGKFIPEENLNVVSRGSDVFRNSIFGNKHYITIQFKTLPNQGLKQQLHAAGIELVDYIPNLAYTAVVDGNFDLTAFRSFPFRSIFQFNTVQKTIPPILNGAIPAHAIKQPGFADVSVITYEKIDAARIRGVLNTLQATILEDMPMFRTFTLRIAEKNLRDLVDLPFVQWVEPIDPPNQKENLLGRSLHRVNVLNDGARNLKGDGINIGIWDEGQVGPHIDFLPSARLTLVEANPSSDHSTHCGGTILGRGIIDPRARGMAPNAQLYSWNFAGNIQNEMFNGIPANNLVVSSHSYGGSVSSCSVNGSQILYSTTSRNTDINLNTYPTHLHVHSAGNSQTACSGGWYTITGSGKTAKNNILVANITTNEGISSSSSFGPTQDGRVKPEISSFGTNVLSTTPNNTYSTFTGTSMATPGVAGSVSLLVQRYKQLNGNSLPPSSLIKNTVCNTAQDLGNTGPDYKFGFGRINALAAVRILEENRYVINTITTGATNDISITVPAGAARLRVMLTWNDPAGSANASPALVNNLNLSAINGATTTLPWVLDPVNPSLPATKAVDNVSNIEQVTVDNPPAGTYTLRVEGFAVPTGPNQQYSLTWNIEQPYIEVTYPNGLESFSPSTSETITWDNAGITGNQTVEYSLNNGVNWTTISSTVPATTTRLAWTVSAGGSTSTALIRVSNGSVTDISDANFRILGVPTTLNTSASCNSGEIVFTWSAVTDATHYDLYRLDEGTGQWVVLSNNIAATTYTATGLTPGASMWFTITARNSTTGAISEKAFAINRIVSAGGGSAIGTITGQATVCGAETNISYTVPVVTGATNYTWTVPPGAAITSGQGTNSIVVTYPGGSTSGDVTVFATSGACNTSTAILNVTVGAAVTAPSSGGDQVQTACPPNPIPTLTATATVPASHTVIWYDAATGGNIVPGPTLNAVGTITYYAVSRNNTSGCESPLRTPVTLTINAAPPATVNAGGPIIFCQGGSVVLTANSGSSYSWSNGATSQAIIVSTSGSYSVTVTQTGGCTGISAPAVVTVNPTPAANITANGATTFCQGSNVVLNASAGSSWLWSNGATTQAITVITGGFYGVRVTNASGCFANSAPTGVVVNPKPDVTLSPAPYSKLFPGLTTTLTASVNPPGGVSYVWLKNGVAIPGATSGTLPVTLDGLGTYSVTITAAGGCTNTSNVVTISDSASSRVFVLPNPNNGQFQVSYYNAAQSGSTAMLTIFDSKGARVFSKSYIINIPYQRMDVDLKKGGKGIYRILITDRTGKKLAVGSVLIQ